MKRIIAACVACCCFCFTGLAVAWSTGPWGAGGGGSDSTALKKAGNLSDLDNASTALTNLGVSDFIKTLMNAGNESAARATLGAEPLLTDGHIWYQNSGGSDSNTGATPGTAKKTIQAAINAAVSYDTIYLAGGPVTENLTITKSLNLIGPATSLTGSITVSGDVNIRMYVRKFQVSGTTLIASSGKNNIRIWCPNTQVFDGGTFYTSDNAEAMLYLNGGLSDNGTTSSQTWFNQAAGTIVLEGDVLSCGQAGSTIFVPAAGSAIAYSYNIIIDPTVYGGGASTLISGSPASTAYIAGNAGLLAFGTLSNCGTNVSGSIVASQTAGALSQSGAGRIELATAQHPARKTVIFKLATDDAIATTGDGKVYFTWPDPGTWEIVSAHTAVYQTGSGDPFDVSIYNVTDSQEVLSTDITIDSGETSSLTAASQPVINTNTNAVVQGEQLRFDINTVTASSKGCELSLIFRYKAP